MTSDVIGIMTPRVHVLEFSGMEEIFIVIVDKKPSDEDMEKIKDTIDRSFDDGECDPDSMLGNVKKLLVGLGYAIYDFETTCIEAS